MAYPPEGYRQFFAVIPEALWRALAEEAAREGRSVAWQLGHILRRRYPGALPAGVEAGRPRGRPRKRPAESE